MSKRKVPESNPAKGAVRVIGAPTDKRAKKWVFLSWDYKNALDNSLQILVDQEQFFKLKCYRIETKLYTAAYVIDIIVENGVPVQYLTMYAPAWESHAVLMCSSKAIASFHERFNNGKAYHYPSIEELIRNARKDLASGRKHNAEVLAVLGARLVEEENRDISIEYLVLYAPSLLKVGSDELKNEFIARQINSDRKLITNKALDCTSLLTIDSSHLPEPATRLRITDLVANGQIHLNATAFSHITGITKPLPVLDMLGLKMSKRKGPESNPAKGAIRVIGAPTDKRAKKWVFLSWDYKNALDNSLQILVDQEQFFKLKCYRIETLLYTAAYVIDIIVEKGVPVQYLTMYAPAWESHAALMCSSKAIASFHERFNNGKAYHYPSIEELIRNARKDLASGRKHNAEVLAVLGARLVKEENGDISIEYLVLYAPSLLKVGSDELKNEFIARQINSDRKLIEYMTLDCTSPLTIDSSHLPKPETLLRITDLVANGQIQLNATAFSHITGITKPLPVLEMLGISESSYTSLLFLRQLYKHTHFLKPKSSEIIKPSVFFEHFVLHNNDKAENIPDKDFICVKSFFDYEDKVTQTNFVGNGNGSFSVHKLPEPTEGGQLGPIMICQSSLLQQAIMKEMRESCFNMMIAPEDKSISGSPLKHQFVKEYWVYALAAYARGMALGCEYCSVNWKKSGNEYFKKVAPMMGVTDDTKIVMMELNGGLLDVIEV